MCGAGVLANGRGGAGPVLPLPRVLRHLPLLLLSAAVVLRVRSVNVGVVGGASDAIDAGGIVENAIAVTAVVIGVGADGAGIAATGVAISGVGVVSVIVKIAVGLGGSEVMSKPGVACTKSMGKMASTLESGKMVLLQSRSQLWCVSVAVVQDALSLLLLVLPLSLLLRIELSLVLMSSPPGSYTSMPSSLLMPKLLGLHG